VPDASGRVHGAGRTNYLRPVLTTVRRAMMEGADLRALHVWSLLDDWQWEDGLTTRASWHTSTSKTNKNGL
jgi:beta-glucosidase